MKFTCTGNFRKAGSRNDEKMLFLRNAIQHDAACELRFFVGNSRIEHLEFQPDSRFPARPHSFEVRRIRRKIKGLAIPPGIGAGARTIAGRKFHRAA